MARGTKLARLTMLAALLALAVLASTAAAAETAPKVTKQPTAMTVEEGQTATFESTASGTPVPTVQWEVSTNGGTSFTPIEGATATKLTIPNTKTSESGNKYRAVFTNTLGKATSNAATLTVRKAPVITKQPQPATVEEGQSAVFEAAAAGSPAPTVAWEVSSDEGVTWTAVTGGTSPTLTVAKAQTSFSGRLYRATFKNVAGTATTESALLTVRKAPSVTKQPTSASVEQGQTATFESTGSGFPAPTEQWEVSTDSGVSWTPVEGATGSQLVVENTTRAQSGSKYRAVFKNAAGEAFSTPATLTVVVPAPVITEQPQSVTVEAGEPASFEATASSFETPTVQWEISTNGGTSWSAVPEATTDQLTIASTQLTENGNQYRAKFTNAGGSTTTAVATLTVASNHYSAVGWGLDTSRQLGDGSFEAFRDVPVSVVGLKFVTAVSAGGLHSLALLASGKVDAWGSDEFGQLGDGGELNRNVPVEVGGLTGVKAIAAGGSHSLALLSNGTVMAWGDNEHGQLGNGSVVQSSVPVAVKNLTGVKAIAAGGEFSLALLNNGTVMAWGDNEAGQLGTGSVKQSNVPVAVKGLSGVAAIAAGSEFAMALLTGGTVDAWGNDESEQLANQKVVEAEETFSDLPVPVEALTGATSIAAGQNHALALLSDGTVKGWGDDSGGELGNGVIEPHSATPVAVSGLSNVDAITAGGQISAALVDGGEVMTWGVNKWGTLGDGVTGSPSDVPVAVPSIAKAASISAGGSHMLAFGEPMPVVTAVSPTAGPSAGGNTVTISGANLEGATAVKFGATNATTYTVTSQTTIEAVAPAGTGKVHVVVTTPAGISNSTTADQYTYVNPPTVTSLTPKTGTTEGGTKVTIKGTEFSTASSVTIGGTSVPFTIVSATQITATTPAHPAGFADTVVTNAGGTSALTTKDRYKYLPIIESVAPNEGPAEGGTSVTVTGSGFALGSTATTFKFGTKKPTAVSCTSSTTCTMLSPPGTAATTVDVTATVNKAVSLKTAADKFSYH